MDGKIMFIDSISTMANNGINPLTGMLRDSTCSFMTIAWLRRDYGNRQTWVDHDGGAFLTPLPAFFPFLPSA